MYENCIHIDLHMPQYYRTNFNINIFMTKLCKMKSAVNKMFSSITNNSEMKFWSLQYSFSSWSFCLISFSVTNILLKTDSSDSILVRCCSLSKGKYDYLNKKKKGKTLTKKLRDLQRKGTYKHTDTYLIYFDNHRYLS